MVYGLKIQAASDDTSQQAGELQHQLGEGPALQALRTGHRVIVHALRVKGRWQQWNAQVTSELGLGSVLSVLLVSDRRRTATLTTIPLRQQP